MKSSETVVIPFNEAEAVDPDAPLVQVKDLEVTFKTQAGIVHAVRGVSFDIYPGESVAIVGESGSGKSTTATAIINLLAGTGRIFGGEILVEGKDITGYSQDKMADVRGRVIGYVPQDPMSNLNPVWSVGFQVEEAVRANGLASNRKEARERAIEVLKQAGLGDAERRMKQFPHQFSGGMRQRVLIGIGLAANPKLLIADEPTSALDVTVQKVILDHLESRVHEQQAALLLITHDLGLAAERASKLIVMHRGRIVEAGPSIEVLQNPQHPYTQTLIAAAPSLASKRIESTSVREAATAGIAVDVARLAAKREEDALANANAPAAIEVSDLTKVYSIRRGSFRSEPLTAVDHINFKVKKGTTLALVGESGSGKTTAAKMILGLEKPTSGEITLMGTRMTGPKPKQLELDGGGQVLKGTQMAGLSRKGLFELRSRMQVVFQDPYASLDPQRSIAAIIAEPLRVHGVRSRAERLARVNELLDQVSLPRSMAHRYPNELSGGQRQRVAVARALALKPDVVVLDEAVSALDVLVQAQVLQLLADLQAELNLTYLFITHDLAVVRVVADEVAVMEAGKIVETGTTDEIFENAKMPYTQRLLDAIPGAGIDWGA